jgi:hypothetical protein
MSKEPKSMQNLTRANPTVAILIPCLNEAKTIGAVVQAFKHALPGCVVYVYDNNSADDTANEASHAGAVVRFEMCPGKGNVVRRMFADIDADVYVLVDGDGTYDASSAPHLAQHLLRNGLDLVNGARVAENHCAYRSGHKLGNRMLTGLVGLIFEKRFTDMLSGYKAFSRRFVKSFPVLTRGFDIETEATIHALEMQMPIGEIPVPYRERPQGSASKLRTFRDGFRILRTIVRLVKEERPLVFFLSIAVVLAVTAILLSLRIFIEYIETGLVLRMPTAVLVTGMMVLAALSFAAGLILDTVTRGRKEMKLLHYLSIPGPLRASESTAREYGEPDPLRKDATRRECDRPRRPLSLTQDNAARSNGAKP